jgi:hypothetical protein
MLHVWNSWLSAQMQLYRVPAGRQVPLKQVPLQHSVPPLQVPPFERHEAQVNLSLALGLQ